MKELIKERIRRSDDIIENQLNAQCTDPDSVYYGNVPDRTAGYNEPTRSILVAATYITRYCHPLSRFYKNRLLLQRALIGLKHGLKHMHPDNTMDLTATNPHDPTSVAFSVRTIVPAFRMLKNYMQKKSSHSALEVKVYNTIINYLTKSADGMVGKGFHTPNHRWVVASGLAMVMNILDMPELMSEINKYLDEGIDCDEYGEYAERSISIYNLTNNESLIILARELNRPEFLEHVRRNLYMSMKYIEPDGTLYTLNSSRQDVGTRIYPFTLFEGYMVMAHIDRNPQFAYMAKVIFDMCSNNPIDTGELGYYCFTAHIIRNMEYSEFFDGEVAILPFDYTHYDAFFPYSDIARMRDGDTSMTVLAKNVMPVKYMYRFLGIYMMFLSDKYMEFDRIEKTHAGYRLYGNDDKTEVILDCVFQPDKATISVEAKADQPYPCAAVLMFDKEGFLQGDGYSLRARTGKNLHVKNGKFTYLPSVRYIPNSLTVESDFTGDEYSKICMNKVLPTDKNSFTVFLTAEAPFRKTITIKKE